jgi:TolB-like protein/Tfp pilus assembly protein PilF
VTDAPIERGAVSWWGSLRRRKVVQWTVAYAAGAWVTLQVLGFAADTYGWPAIVAQLAMLGLALGLPVVVTLAWFHGERSQQRVTGRELAILTVLLLIGGGLLWWYADRRAAAPAAAGANTPAPAANADSRPSIAVLPFDNRSKLEDDAFFVDGIHDDILTQLSKISALKVISRTSVERFRASELSVREIAQQLGVRSILEGGVQRAGDRVRINVQLIDAATDAHVWAESYDRDLIAANIFAIQSEVATAVADALRAALTPSEKARVNAVPTRNLASWEAYQLGKHRMVRRTGAGLKEAERFFRKSIDLDPTFALAHVGLADAVSLQIDYGGAPRAATVAAAEQAVSEALRLDSSLAEAWVSSASIADNRLQYDRAEQMYLRAIDLNPSYATAHHWYSNLLANRNRLEESLRHAEISAELDPLSAIIQINLAGVLESIGRFADAESRYRKAIEIEPDMPSAYAKLGRLFAFGKGRIDLAIPWYARAASLEPDGAGTLAALAELYRAIGDKGQAALWLERALKHGPHDAIALRTAAAASYEAGDREAARSYAARASAAEPLAMNLLRDDDLGKGD